MSLGIAVRRWVTWHGVALNVTTDLAPFRRFNPCGLDGSVMTSLADRLGRDPGMAHVRALLVRHASDLLPPRRPLPRRPPPGALLTQVCQAHLCQEGTA